VTIARRRTDSTRMIEEHVEIILKLSNAARQSSTTVLRVSELLQPALRMYVVIPHKRTWTK
jgi:hypothetical protein